MNILITGASKGLGFSTVSEALKGGHHVIAGVRNLQQSHEQFEATRQEHPGQLELIQLDVNVESEIIAAKNAVERRWGTVDVLINNAGILIARDKKLEQLDMAEVERSMMTNLYGPMKMVKHFLPLLRRSARPCIINISSEAGCFTAAYGRDYPYALSKSALSFFSAQLRKELAPQGFAVYNVHPGWIRTPMGGEQAPGDPGDTAIGLLNLAERKVVPAQESWMITHKGEPMPY
ncbi:SDR family NAD(P)-dependent oxidoreductase [Paenibacillus sp. FSL W8-0186]|uniref:SDR family NAD(P)-dependent oxidoreductase n=1 Tax=Paenibacillus sp. FSL W8-0186 TaxID=2921709 RepID=UPI0030CBBCAC